jgi:hypothetical protein
MPRNFDGFLQYVEDDKQARGIYRSPWTDGRASGSLLHEPATGVRLGSCRIPHSVARKVSKIGTDCRRYRRWEGWRRAHENLASPAIDPLFRSAAAAYGPEAVGIELSGQLHDDTAGMIAITVKIAADRHCVIAVRGYGAVYAADALFGRLQSTTAASWRMSRQQTRLHSSRKHRRS